MLEADQLQDLYKSTFQYLEDAVLEHGTTQSMLDLLMFYRDLLDRWAVSLLSQPEVSAYKTQAVASMITHCNNLALNIVQASFTVGSVAVVLNFYESVASLVCHPSVKAIIRITIPPAELVYNICFTNSLSNLSRLCSILALYKRAFETAMTSKPTDPSLLDQQSYEKGYVNHFNGFLMDICNCLWRSRAFSTSDPNALGCLLSSPVSLSLGKYVSNLDTALTLPSLFGFSYSPAFCLLSISYMRELEDNTEEVIERRHPGPVTQNSLKQLEQNGGLSLPWQKYKLGFLHYLEDRGVNGVAELLYNTLKHLMNARESNA